MTTIAERRKRAEEVIRLRDELGQQRENLVLQLGEADMKLACEVKGAHSILRQRRVLTLDLKKKNMRDRRDKLNEELDTLGEELLKILKSLK